MPGDDAGEPTFVSRFECCNYFFVFCDGSGPLGGFLVADEADALEPRLYHLMH